MYLPEVAAAAAETALATSSGIAAPYLAYAFAKAAGPVATKPLNPGLRTCGTVNAVLRSMTVGAAATSVARSRVPVAARVLEVCMLTEV